MKKLSNAALLDLIEALWEERMGLIREGSIYSALLAGVMFVLWYMTSVTGGTSWWFIAGWALAQAGIGIYTVIGVREIDRKAGEAVENSHAFGAFFKE